MEIKFVDPFGCNGYCFKGTARIVPKGARSSLEFVGLVARNSPPLLADRYRAMVVMHVTNELPTISPAYDVGATESGLRKPDFELIQLVDQTPYAGARRQSPARRNHPRLDRLGG